MHNIWDLFVCVNNAPVAFSLKGMKDVPVVSAKKVFPAASQNIVSISFIYAPMGLI